jgi:hypothetical protein
MGEWRYSSIILDLCARWRWVVSSTPRRLLYSRGRNPWQVLDWRLGGPQSRWSGLTQSNLLLLPVAAQGHQSCFNSLTSYLTCFMNNTTELVTDHCSGCAQFSLNVYFLVVCLEPMFFCLLVCLEYPSTFTVTTINILILKLNVVAFFRSWKLFLTSPSGPNANSVYSRRTAHFEHFSYRIVSRLTHSL